jgi:hypothetical protein
VEYGERLVVVGSDTQLGAWDAGSALKLKWHEGDVWSGSADLPVGVDVEFKVWRECLSVCRVVLRRDVCCGGAAAGGVSLDRNWTPRYFGRHE